MFCGRAGFEFNYDINLNSFVVRAFFAIIIDESTDFSVQLTDLHRVEYKIIIVLRIYVPRRTAALCVHRSEKITVNVVGWENVNDESFPRPTRDAVFTLEEFG